MKKKKCFHLWRSTLSGQHKVCHNCGEIRTVEKVQNVIKKA